MDSKSHVVPVAIENEMQQSYLDYAMSVIVSRALPDCRDGFKPVHRRILYAMHSTGNHYNKPYRKSARVVGEVMGKYHPHGDMPIYGALVRMAQNFSLRAPLVDGQGNFGSIDGDSPAHMRYTEARLEKITDLGLLLDIDYDTVDFQDNYDGSEREPTVLPARFPNLLVNGANGIAVGMATNIPTHNIGEVVDACCAYLENEHISVEELMQYVPAPDFPGGGEILGYKQSRIALTTGRGSIIMRGGVVFETLANNRKAIVITSIPYQVNKSELVKSIEVLNNTKVIEGLAEISDETNKLGIRVVIELKKDVEPEVVLNQLYRHTQLQTTFGVNMLALSNGLPVLMNLRSAIASFLKFREEIITRRTKYLLNKARDKAHVLIGLLIALESIDQVIALIKGATDVLAAKEALLSVKWPAHTAKEFVALVDSPFNKFQSDSAFCYLSEEQVKAILEMRLQRLTGLEYSKIVDELKTLASEITDSIRILNSRSVLLNIIRDELLEIKQNFDTPRCTQIVDAAAHMEDEDLIQEEDVVVIVTKNGYIKRTSLDGYRTQRRGGRGRIGMNVYEDDTITKVLVSSTHDALLFFSNLGRVYKIKVYKLPVCSMQSKGRAIVNILALSSPGERITNIITLSKELNAKKAENDDEYHNDSFVGDIDDSDNGDDDSSVANYDAQHDHVKDDVKTYYTEEDNAVAIRDTIPDSSICDDEGEIVAADTEVSILFATKNGKVRRNKLSDFHKVPTSGKIAIKLDDDDRLVGVTTCLPSDHVLLATKQGKAVRFPVNNLRIFKSRTSDGVIGVVLSLQDDAVVSMSMLRGVEIDYQKRDALFRIDAAERIKIARIALNGDYKQAEEVAAASLTACEISHEELSVTDVINLVRNEEFIITINSFGFGKLTSAYDYRVVNRGSKGIINMNLDASNAYVVSSFAVKQDDEILIFSEQGVVIRTAIDQIRIAGRNTIGVRLINLKDENDNVSSISMVPIDSGSEVI